jgi:hypothetical protein
MVSCRENIPQLQCCVELATYDMSRQLALEPLLILFGVEAFKGIKEITTVKPIRYFLFMVALLLLVLPLAQAQTAALYVGFGSNYDKSSSSGISQITGGTCTPGQDASCSAPKLKGFFLGFGGEAMLDKHFGAGAEISFQPTKYDYGPFQYRQMFYDFNGIYMPVNAKRVGLKFMGGLGGARSGFSFSSTSCYGTAVCNKYSSSIGSSNHFQLHAGAGVDIMLTGNLMMRPQFDLRYVPSLTDQFGRDIVTGGMIWIGFRVNNR